MGDTTDWTVIKQYLGHIDTMLLKDHIVEIILFLCEEKSIPVHREELVTIVTQSV